LYLKDERILNNWW